ncbi:MAG: SpvB/TcaC N-terminal domain-containing protein, partial [Nitrospira sp.]
MSSQATSPSQIIALPKGGGAQKGLGEKFSPDLHTGTGNFTVPITHPPGRNGFQPQLSLVYSSGNGNGYFGLGWSLSIPGVMRKTSKGIPRYRDDDGEATNWDTFVLSGAEDLVPVEDPSPDPLKATRYRPRTEGLFAKIIHHHDTQTDTNYWEVRSKDGLISYYGDHPTERVAQSTSATITKPKISQTDPNRIFAWKLTLTQDPFGNRIEYLYADRDHSTTPDERQGRQWDQPLLTQIRYADYHESDQTKFLVTVSFQYEDRFDPFSDYRAGFELRTTKRCKSIIVETHADQTYNVRRYDFSYDNQAKNGVSLLTGVDVVGFDDAGTDSKELPPLEFGYSQFNPQDRIQRDLYPVEGADLPATSLANTSLELVDLYGNGLPDILEMNGTVRYWRNRGNGRFDRPRSMADAPAGLSLGSPGVQLIDANGDGRTDLLVTQEVLTGYYPLQFDGQWARRSFHQYAVAPSFDLKDPEVRLIDLTGDGVTDVLRSSTRFECFFNDPQKGWGATRRVERGPLKDFPNVNFSDPRVKSGDLSGDGLQDIVLIHDGSVDYWPNLGYGEWGKRLRMTNSPRFPFGYDPRRILIGDVDGDGLADLLYIEDRKVTLWINQSGNGWSTPIEILGTPPVSDLDATRIIDLLGSGISGVLWTKDATSARQDRYLFLDLTGGTKPYLLNEMNNNMGAITKVGYKPSTTFYIDDEALT